MSPGTRGVVVLPSPGPSPGPGPIPGPSAGRLVGLLVGLLVLLTACSPDASPVPVTTSTLSAADAATCRALVAGLPATLAQQPTRPVTPPDAPGAAWGDPAITLTCGAPVPREFNEFSSCVQADGVGWFVPESQQQDQGADVTWTTVGHRPVLRVDVPAEYRPEGAAAVISELAGPVERHLRLVQRCR